MEVNILDTTDLLRPIGVRTTPHEQKDIEVLGLRLRYIDVPSVGPNNGTLLLIHGHTSRIEEYDDLIPHLNEHHRILICDLPGCGYSDKPERVYNLRFYEDVLLAFLDALGVQEAFVAGGSLGGNLVLRLGHREPERFSRLVAWAPAGAWKPAKVLSQLIKVMGGRALFWPMVWGQSRFWYEKSWPGRADALKETFAYYREIYCQGFIRMYWDMARDQLEQSHFEYAHQIQQPTLLAWGDKDHGMNMGDGVKRLREILPQAKLRVFSGAKHSLANEIPEHLAEVTNSFLLSTDPLNSVPTAH